MVCKRCPDFAGTEGTGGNAGASRIRKGEKFTLVKNASFRGVFFIALNMVLHSGPSIIVFISRCKHLFY
jgi:hypothetical protein